MVSSTFGRVHDEDWYIETSAMPGWSMLCIKNDKNDHVIKIPMIDWVAKEIIKTRHDARRYEAAYKLALMPERVDTGWRDFLLLMGEVRVNNFREFTDYVDDLRTENDRLQAQVLTTFMEDDKDE